MSTKNIFDIDTISNTSQFDAFITILFNLLIKHNIDGFNQELKLFNRYRIRNYDYLNIFEQNVIAKLIDNISNYIASVDSMNNQIVILEQNLLRKTYSEQFTVIANTKYIEQNTKLKLEYIQYMLLFDLNESNGVFIDEYINVAKDLLRINNNVLTYNF